MTQMEVKLINAQIVLIMAVEIENMIKIQAYMNRFFPAKLNDIADFRRKTCMDDEKFLYVLK